MVDDFGVKYVGKENAPQHLIECLKEKYKLIEDWTDNLYCGMKLEWDYRKRQLLFSMLGKTTHEIQAHHFPPLAALPILTGTQKNMAPKRNLLSPPTYCANSTKRK